MVRGVKNQRESNFELLRILSMFMIVVWHICVHGIEKNEGFSNLSEINQLLFYSIKAFTVIGVNVYILISGYFLCKSKVFKTQKVVRLILETFLFSIGIYLVLIAMGLVTFSLNSAVTSFFPVFFGEYWFVSVYLVLFILSPYLNLLIKTLNKNAHLKLIVISFFIVCVWQFLYSGVNLGVNFGTGLLHFVFLYILAAYVRNYGFLIKELKRSHYMMIYFALAVTIAVGSYVLSNSVDRLYAYNSPIVVFMAYSMFMFFKHLNFRFQTINTSAVFVFGIYLIHDNGYLREIFWNELGIIERVINSQLMFTIGVLGLGVLVFLISWCLSFVVTSLISLVFNFYNKKISDRTTKTHNLNT